MTESLKQPDDLTRLLEAATKGDERAWHDLVGLYARRVFALAKSRLKREDLAEEITQSVFVTVATKLSTGAYTEQGKFESWLFRVAMNRVRDEIRRSKTRAESRDPTSFDETVGQREDADPARTDRGQTSPKVIEGLRTAMNDLTDADREIVELRHHGGMSFKHIAELLGEPMGTVLARHHRALKKLRDVLGSLAPGLDRGES